MNENNNPVANIVNIKRFAVHDGNGIRTTVFFKGCPLRCKWCHNPETYISDKQIGYYARKCVNCGRCITVCPQGCHFFENGVHRFNGNNCLSCEKCVTGCASGAMEKYGEKVSVEKICSELIRDKIFYDASGGGITLSGGECLLQSDACREILVTMKKNGISTAVDTCGFVPRKSIDKVIPFTDVFLYDIKHIDSEKHIVGTGKPNGLILENLIYLDSVGAKIEIRYPLIPDYNDDEPTLIETAKFISELKNVTAIAVLPYNNLAGSKYAALNMDYKSYGKTADEEKLLKAKNVFARYANVKIK